MIAIWDGDAWRFEAPGGPSGGGVNAVAVEGSDVYVGGTFTAIGGVPAGRVARWDGQTWNPLTTGTNGPVMAIAATGTGDVYFGGEFTQAGDSLVNRVARWNGFTWYPLYDQGLIARGTNGRVNAIQATSEGVYVAGTFSTAGGQTGAGNVARWNRTIPAWTRLGTGTNGEIFHIGAFGSTITVSGQFTTPAQFIAQWNGSTWDAMGNPFTRPTEMEVAPNGSVYASAFFTSTSRNVARYFGGTWLPLGNAVDLDSWVMDATDTLLFLNYQGGWIPGLVPEVAVRWDGTRFTGMGNGIGRFWTNVDFIRAFAEYGGELYAAGLFPNAGADSMANIARWNGTRWAAVPGFQANLPVQALHSAGGNLYAGGTFSMIGGTTVNGISRFDGTAWRAMGSGLGAVNAIETSGGAVYAGGSFTITGPPVIRGVARWSGTAWEPLRGGVYGTAFAAEDAGTGVWVGGQFSFVDSTTPAYQFNHVARWDGTRWAGLAGGVSGSPQAAVYALARRGTDLFVGGEFTMAGSVPASNIARWDGSSWHALGSGVSGPVEAIVANGSDVYVGGRFNLAGSDSVWSIARWDGTRWHKLGSGLRKDINFSAQPTVRGMLGTSQGLYLGGDFTHAGAGLSNRIALWTNFNPVSAGETPAVPQATSLAQNFPNPFNPVSTIEFGLPAAGVVHLEVFDMLGRHVATLVRGEYPAGAHRVTFDAKGLASGMYLYRLESGSFTETRKMILLR
jgi:hypothetical protein